LPKLSDEEKEELRLLKKDDEDKDEWTWTIKNNW